MEYVYKSLENISAADIADAFNIAFSDYAISAVVTGAYLSQRFYNANVDFSLSFGAFYEGTLVGFIVNAVEEYCGSLCAYDISTGIAPSHRGKGIFQKLFALTKQSLADRSVSRYGLEALINNQKALHLHQKHGLMVTR